MGHLFFVPFFYQKLIWFCKHAVDPATATAVADPTKNLEVRETGFLYMLHQRSRFLHVSLSAFLLPQVAQISYAARYPVYQQNLFRTRCQNSSQKKSYEVSNLAVLRCSAGSKHHSVQHQNWRHKSPIFPIIFNTFPLSDLD